MTLYMVLGNTHMTLSFQHQLIRLYNQRILSLWKDLNNYLFGNFDYTCRRRGVNLHFSTFFRGTTYSTPRGNMFVFMRLIMLQHTLLLHEYWESNSAVEVLGSSLGRSAWTVRKTSIFQRFATQQSFRAPDGVPIRKPRNQMIPRLLTFSTNIVLSTFSVV